jgi:mRNA interferase YafQ
MTKFEFIRTNTGERQLPDDINRAIATAAANGYRLQIMKLPDTEEGIVDIVGRTDELVPNAETLNARAAAERGELVGPFKTVDELFADLHADD